MGNGTTAKLQALEEENARLRALLAEPSVVLYTCHAADPHATTAMTDSVRELLGFQAAAFVGEPDLRLHRTHPDDLEAVRAALAAAAEGRRTDLRYRVQHADGTHRWVRDTLSRASGATDGRGAITGCWVDITEYVRGGDLTTTVTDSLPLLVVYLDQGRVCRYANRPFAEWFHSDPEDICGRPVREILGEAAYSEVSDHVGCGLRGERVETTHALSHPTMGPRTLATTFTPHVSDDVTEGVFLLGLDITERTRAEATVRASEAKLRSLMDAAVDGIITIDERGVIESVNPAASQLFGYAPGELHDQPLSVLMPDPDQTAHAGYLSSYLATGKAEIIGVGREVEGLRKDGSEFPLYLSVGEAKHGDRRLFTGIVRDITQRKAMEDEIAAASAELEARIEERTEALARETAEHRATAERLQRQIDSTTQVLRGARCALWHALVEDAPTGMAWTSLGREVSEFFELPELGAGEAEDYQAAWWGSVPREDIERINSLAADAVRGGDESYAIEYRILDASGATWWFRDDVSVEALEPGRWSAVGVTTDVTTLKSAERVQKAVYDISEAVHTAADPTDMHRSIYASLSQLVDAPGYVIMLTPAGDATHFDFAYWVMGYEERQPRQHVLPRGRSARVARSGRTEYLTGEDTARLARSGEIDLYDAPTGAWLGVPLYADGALIGVASLLHPDENDPYTRRDIEVFEYVCQQISVAIDRRRTQEALMTEQRLFAALMEHIPDTIYLKDRDSRFLRVNDVCARILGLPSPQAAVGLTDGDVYPHDRSTVFRAEERAVMDTGESIVGRVSTDDIGGWVSITKAPIRDESGAVVGLVGVNRDVSDAMRAQEALRERDAERTLLMERTLAAQEDERGRIARDLHDRVGQELTAVLLGLRTIEAAGDMAAARRQAVELRELAATTLEDVRQIAFDMRPSSLDDLGIVPTLRRELEVLGRNAQLETSLTVRNPDDTPLPSELDVGLYRIVHTALTNVVRHSNAGRVDVVLEIRAHEDGARVSALVQDNGDGFDVDALLAGPVEGRFGLVSMQERAHMIGGEVTLTSLPTEGTAVFVSIPPHDDD